MGSLYGRQCGSRCGGLGWFGYVCGRLVGVVLKEGVPGVVASVLLSFVSHLLVSGLRRYLDLPPLVEARLLVERVPFLAPSVLLYSPDASLGFQVLGSIGSCLPFALVSDSEDVCLCLKVLLRVFS